MKILYVLSIAILISFGTIEGSEATFQRIRDYYTNDQLSLVPIELKPLLNTTPLSQWPADIQAIYGIALVTGGNVKDGVPILEQVKLGVESVVSQNAVLYHLANAYFSQGKYDRALVKYQQLISNHLNTDPHFVAANKRVEELSQLVDTGLKELSSQLVQAEMLFIGKADLDQAMKICDEIIASRKSSDLSTKARTLQDRIRKYYRETISQKVAKILEDYQFNHNFDTAKDQFRKVFVEVQKKWLEGDLAEWVQAKFNELKEMHQRVADEQPLHRPTASGSSSPPLESARRLIKTAQSEKDFLKIHQLLKPVLPSLSDTEAKEASAILEAVEEGVIKSRREKASQLFLDAKKEKSPATKEKLLRESLSLLKSILSDFPSTPLRPKIESHIGAVKKALLTLNPNASF